MTRLAPILLALFCLLTAAYGGEPDGWLVWSAVRSYEQAAIATKDGDFLMADEFPEIRRPFLASRLFSRNTQPGFAGGGSNGSERTTPN